MHRAACEAMSPPFRTHNSLQSGRLQNHCMLNSTPIQWAGVVGNDRYSAFSRYPRRLPRARSMMLVGGQPDKDYTPQGLCNALSDLYGHDTAFSSSQLEDDFRTRSDNQPTAVQRQTESCSTSHEMEPRVAISPSEIHREAQEHCMSSTSCGASRASRHGQDFRGVLQDETHLATLRLSQSEHRAISFQPISYETTRSGTSHCETRTRAQHPDHAMSKGIRSIQGLRPFCVSLICATGR